MKEKTIKATNNKVWEEKEYKKLDKGIRFPVRVLHAAGFETCQSCEGGSGHSYELPTIEMVSGGRDANGWGALAALENYGIRVFQLSITWPIKDGMPYEKNWTIALEKKLPERANEKPMFISNFAPHH